MKKVLVIVVVYNGMAWLSRCLGSVSESSLGADLFIVDNGSSDGSVEFVKEQFPQAVLKVDPSNPGFAAANNEGLSYALENGNNIQTSIMTKGDKVITLTIDKDGSPATDIAEK